MVERSETPRAAAAHAVILVVDDDESLRRVTSYHLEQAGYAVQSVATGDEALRLLAAPSAGAPAPDLVVTDVLMPGISGLQLLQRIKAEWPEIGVVVITAHGSIEDAVSAMRAGAHDYLVKPFDHQALILTVQKGLRFSRLLRENERLRELTQSAARFETLVGASDALRRVVDAAAQVAVRPTTVLIQGESGTGKELLARAIHLASPRADGPFVAVNVGALPDGLIDSELFGHVRGSFTGATSDRKGRFELAHGGTLFLDEIGELRVDLQVKLLRALQEGEIQRVGDTSPVLVDVRVIAATNRDLEALVAKGEFREDLYYRLAVVPLHLPPLRDRRDDIPLLVRSFLAAWAERDSASHRKSRGRAGAGSGDAARGGPAAAPQAPPPLQARSAPQARPLPQAPPSPGITDAAMDALARYRWPGNVRELHNVLEHALVLHASGQIELADLPERIRAPQRPSPSLVGELPEEGIDLEELEKELIRRALDKCGGNQSRTARYLGITRNTLLYRLEKYGFKPPRAATGPADAPEAPAEIADAGAAPPRGVAHRGSTADRDVTSPRKPS